MKNSYKNYKKKYNARSMIQSEVKRAVNRFYKPELKYQFKSDLSYNTISDAGSTIIQLPPILGAGDTATSREGAEVALKSIWVKTRLANDSRPNDPPTAATFDALVKVSLVMDNQPKGAPPVTDSSTIYSDDGPISFKNQEWRNRFKILKSKVVRLSSAAGPIKYVSHYHKFKTPMRLRWNNATADTPHSGCQLYLVIQQDQNQPGVDTTSRYSYNSKVTYYDI